MVWVTWERHRRTRELAKRLNVPLYEILTSKSGIRRYLSLTPRTAAILFRTRPRLLIVQCPSLVLGVVAVLMKVLLRFDLVVDAHNEAVEPYSAKGPVPRILSRIILRYADFAIVTNGYLVPKVEEHGGRPLVLPDPLPDLSLPEDVETHDSERVRVVLIATFAGDEPVATIFSAVGRMADQIELFVTGDDRRLPEHLRARLPMNVTLTGFLSDEAYIRLLASADFVIDLTTKNHCLVCGAYEAVALGVPMVLTDDPATREHFSRGAVYTAPDVDAIERALGQAILHRTELRHGVTQLRAQIEETWPIQLSEVRAELNMQRNTDKFTAS